MDSMVETTSGYTLPPDVIEYRELARKIVREELLPLEPKYLAHKGASYGLQPLTNLRRVYPKDITDRLEKLARETGLWYLMVPEEYSGHDMSALARMVVIEQFMYTAVPFPFVNVPNILYQCKGEQIDRYLKPAIEGTRIHCFAQTEPNAGSDPGGMMKTSAVPKGDGWVINGTKMWISGAAESDFILVQAVTDPEKRQRGGITMFIVERNNPGVKIEEPGISTWLGSTPSTYIVHFDDCYVEPSAILGEVGNGFRLGQKWLTIHDRLMRGPYSLGKMQRSLDMSRDWAKQRVTFGKPLSERQAIQWRLVEMFVDINALRAMTYEVASRADAGEDVRAEAAMVKMCASEWGARCLDNAIQIHGAMGESLELPLTLFYRYLRHYQIGGGSNEIQRMLLARKILGQ
jgi:alkylation response protein AidB-like acyl-CoA dehydrogenase